MAQYQLLQDRHIVAHLSVYHTFYSYDTLGCLNCCWIMVAFFFVWFGLHVHGVSSMGTSCITNEHFNFQIVVIHIDYWRFFIWYGTRIGFTSLSISQSQCGVQTLETVVTNAYPTFAQQSINSLLLVIPWISKLTEISILFTVMKYVIRDAKTRGTGLSSYDNSYVRVSFSLQKVVSTEVNWYFLLPATFRSWISILICLDRKGARLRINYLSGI